MNISKQKTWGKRLVVEMHSNERCRDASIIKSVTRVTNYYNNSLAAKCFKIRQSSRFYKYSSSPPPAILTPSNSFKEEQFFSIKSNFNLGLFNV